MPGGIYPRKSVEERLRSKVNEHGPLWNGTHCWLWKGKLTPKGYALLKVGTQMQRAHRVSYRLYVGIIPAELTIDHLCRIRHCMQPYHLEPVTQAVNVLRGNSPSAIAARKTHCPQGHPYGEVEIQPNGKRRRRCLPCVKTNRARYNARKGARA